MWVTECLGLDSKYYNKLKKLPTGERREAYKYIRAVSSFPCFTKKEASKIVKARKEVNHDIYKERQDVYGKTNKIVFVDIAIVEEHSFLRHDEQEENDFKSFQDMDIGIWLNQRLETVLDEINALEKDNGAWLKPWIEFVQQVYCITVIQERSMRKNRKVSEKQLELLKRFLKTANGI